MAEKEIEESGRRSSRGLRIGDPYFTCYPPWYGRLRICVKGLGIAKDQGLISSMSMVMSEIVRKARGPCLIQLMDPTKTLPDPTALINLAKAKAFSVGHSVDCQDYFPIGQLPKWILDLQEVVLYIENPQKFEQIEAFNEAIQDLWFIEGHIAVYAACLDQEDLSMIYYLNSLVPNDIPFYVSVLAMGERLSEISLKVYDDPQTLRVLFPAITPPENPADYIRLYS